MKRWDEKLVELADMVAPGFLDGAQPLDEADHFYVCSYCDQAVDMRRLGDVLHHDQPGHQPLARQ